MPNITNYLCEEEDVILEADKDGQELASGNTNTIKAINRDVKEPLRKQMVHW